MKTKINSIIVSLFVLTGVISAQNIFAQNDQAMESKMKVKDEKVKMKIYLHFTLLL